VDIVLGNFSMVPLGSYTCDDCLVVLETSNRENAKGRKHEKQGSGGKPSGRVAKHIQHAKARRFGTQPRPKNLGAFGYRQVWGQEKRSRPVAASQTPPPEERPQRLKSIGHGHAIAR